MQPIEPGSVPAAVVRGVKHEAEVLASVARPLLESVAESVREDVGALFETARHHPPANDDAEPRERRLPLGFLSLLAGASLLLAAAALQAGVEEGMAPRGHRAHHRARHALRPIARAVPRDVELQAP